MDRHVVLIGDLSHLKLQRIQEKSLKLWKTYTKHKINRERALHKAIYSYNVRLKQKVLNAFSENRMIIEKDQACNENLNELKNANFSKKSYHVRSTYTKNQRRRKAAYTRISDFRNEVLLRKYITDWKVLCVQKKRNVKLQEKAIEYHTYLLLRKSLRRWIQIHTDILNERKKTTGAIVHYHRKLLTKFWFAWMKYCNVKITRSNRMEQSSKFYERKLLARSFKLLSLNVSVMIEKRENYEISTNHYADRLLRRVLRSWIEYQRVKSEFENLVNKQRRKMKNLSKSNVLRQWRVYVWRKKCYRRKMNVSRSHYDGKLAKGALASLRNYLMYRKKKKNRLSRLRNGEDKISLGRLAIHVDKWRIAVIRITQERQKYRRAEDHWSFRQIERYFVIWKLYSENYKLKNKRKEALGEIGKILLLSKYTSVWSTKCRAMMKIRDEERRVLSLYEKKLQVRYFCLWKTYREGKNARKAEFEEATKFHRKIMLREGLKDILKMSLYKSETRYEKHLKCATKNSIDNFEIMRKFFVRWLSYVSHNDKWEAKKLISSGLHRGICEFSPEPTCLVLPEYMTKKSTRRKSKNALSYEENSLKNVCKNLGLEKIWRSSRITCDPKTACSPSNSEKSMNLSIQMHDTGNHFDEENRIRSFFDILHNSSFSD